MRSNRPTVGPETQLDEQQAFGRSELKHFLLANLACVLVLALMACIPKLFRSGTHLNTASTRNAVSSFAMDACKNR